LYNLNYIKMDEKELIDEIIGIVHEVAGHDFRFRSLKRDALVKIRNKILEFKGENMALEQVVIYLNGFIEGLNH